MARKSFPKVLTKRSIQYKYDEIIHYQTSFESYGPLCNQNLKYIYIFFFIQVKDNIAGPAYCESTYNVGDVATCKEWIELMGVQAISALGSLLAVSSERICGELGCTK